MSLRERLAALADAHGRENVPANGSPFYERLALAAARMALDEAAKECDRQLDDAMNGVYVYAIRKIRDQLTASGDLGSGNPVGPTET